MGDFSENPRKPNPYMHGRRNQGGDASPQKISIGGQGDAFSVKTRLALIQWFLNWVRPNPRGSVRL